eukprot:TRINITY_DN657_c0_g1_i1.p2 TRINITY_DN657_c0_g1~~TRINITY_DN657_c0_g1_i1.p2  ORF type:complete len:103 (-),score=15.23 TRINITY_DN657_c0_g1_i1:1500-1808(-)
MAASFHVHFRCAAPGAPYMLLASACINATEAAATAQCGASLAAASRGQMPGSAAEAATTPCAETLRVRCRAAAAAAGGTVQECSSTTCTQVERCHSASAVLR